MPKCPVVSTTTSGPSTPKAVASVTPPSTLFQVNFRMLTPQRKGDGLRHFGYQKERKFYNGVTMDDIHAEPKSTVLGIQGSHIACASYRTTMALSTPSHPSMVQARHRWTRHPPRLCQLARSTEAHRPTRALPDRQHQARAPQGSGSRAGHRHPLRRHSDHPLRYVRANARDMHVSPPLHDARATG